QSGREPVAGGHRDLRVLSDPHRLESPCLQLPSETIRGQVPRSVHRDEAEVHQTLQVVRQRAVRSYCIAGASAESRRICASWVAAGCITTPTTSRSTWIR